MRSTGPSAFSKFDKRGICFRSTLQSTGDSPATRSLHSMDRRSGSRSCRACTPHFRKTFPETGPMMNGEYRKGGIERFVPERQLFGTCLNDKCIAWKPLIDHHLGGFDSGDFEMGRFVRTGSGSDVQNGFRTVQLDVDRFGNSRIGSADFGEIDPDGVAECAHSIKVRTWLP